MSVNNVDMLVGDTTRKPSASIWGRMPLLDIIEGNVEGFYYEDDFLTLPGGSIPTTEGALGRYAAFSSTGGTIAQDTTEKGGAWAFGSDGDNEGASIRSGVTPFKLIQGVGRFAFEARVLTSTIADTKHGIFLGLLEDTALTATVPIAAAGTLADKNFVGFHRLEGDGDYFDTVYKADGVTQVTVQSDAALLVAATYTKLGMYFEPLGDKAGAYALSFYQDGTRLSTTKLLPSAAGTDFPNDISLGLVFAVLNATGTTPGTSTIDWWRAAQLINP